MIPDKVRRTGEPNRPTVEEIFVVPIGGPDNSLFDRQNIAPSQGPIRVRETVRSTRSDIGAWLCPCRLFKRRIFHPVKLLDISRHGAAVASGEPLRKKCKALLKLRFRDGAEFTVLTQVSRVIDKDTSSYGLCFLENNPSLNDHLVKTGLQLKLHSRVPDPPC